MIDARTAHQQTRSQGRISECMNIIETAIGSAIDKGAYNCSVTLSGSEYGSLIETLVSILSGKYGYIVQTPVQKIIRQKTGLDGKMQTYADYTLKISWN